MRLGTRRNDGPTQEAVAVMLNNTRKNHHIFLGMGAGQNEVVSVTIDQFNEEELKRSIDNTIIDVPNFDITKK